MKIVTFLAEEMMEEWMIRWRSRPRRWRASNLGHGQQEQQEQLGFPFSDELDRAFPSRTEVVEKGLLSRA